MKLAAIIVAYYPIVTELKNNCLEYIDITDQLIIWDNTPGGISQEDQLFLSVPSDKICYLSNGHNMGIGYALNQAIALSKKNGMTHLLALDQDSVFKKEEILKIIQTINKYKADNEIGIFSPNIINQFSKKQLPLYDTSKEVIVVNRSITSGSIFRLNIFEDAGYFREDIFIDDVDYEFCYRAKKNGYNTIIVCNSLLYQKFSNMKQTKWGFFITNYSPFRLYHIIRNGIIVQKEYPNFTPGWYRLIVYSIIIRSIKILFFEKNKISKLKAILVGIYDGIFDRVYERNFIG